MRLSHRNINTAGQHCLVLTIAQLRNEAESFPISRALSTLRSQAGAITGDIENVPLVRQTDVETGLTFPFETRQMQRKSKSS